MLNLKVDIPVDKVLRQFGDMAEKQLPFATARALTWTAKEAQKEAQRNLPHQFITRNNWVKQGIRIEAARKYKWESAVGSITDFMGLQQEGGEKRPKGRHLAIPVNAKRNKKDIVTKANRPRRILNKKNTFKIDETTPMAQRHGLPFGIYKQMSERKLSLMYLLIPSGDVAGRFELDKTTTEVVSKRFDRLFYLSLEQAMK